MEEFLVFEHKKINIFSLISEVSNKLILFLPGGGKDVGRTRFLEWQEKLVKDGFSSFSFDFSGVGKSSGTINYSSLEERISEAVFIINWIKQKYPNKKLSLYGVSMGGYVALGAINNLGNCCDGIILQNPAAYSETARTKFFDNSFTEELHRRDSWKESASFDWLSNFNGKKILIMSEKDEIIPNEITQRYRKFFQTDEIILISEAPHSIWSTSSVDSGFRAYVYNHCLLPFLKGS